MKNSCLTLDLALISKDETLSKFWNKSCQEIQSSLFLPHQTVSQEVGLRSSKKLLNFMEEKSSFWKTIIKPKVSMLQPLSLSLLHSATHKVGNEIIVTRKIRIYPKNKSQIFDLLSLHRRAYNLTIEHFKTIEFKDQLKVVELRRLIKLKVKAEWDNRNYRAEVAGEAVRAAFRTKSAIIAKRKKGLKCDYKFKSIKETYQYFIEQRLTKKFMTNFHVTEAIKKESFGRTTNICFKYGRWFVCTLRSIALQSAENQGFVCAIDPGVRTFATTFNGRESVKYGDNFYYSKVFPLLLKLDKCVGKKKKPVNKINKLKNRINDLVSDLHRRVGFDLVSNNDIILMPAFETSEMVSKENRKIRTKTVRAMLGLAHYKFKELLKWMCKKYNKTFVEVNEAYTSKTMSWNGNIKENLNGNKIISDGHIRVDRDVNAARNILLRSLTVA